MAILHMNYRSRFELAGGLNRLGLSFGQGAAALGVWTLYRPNASMMDNEKFLL